MCKVASAATPLRSLEVPANALRILPLRHVLNPPFTPRLVEPAGIVASPRVASLVVVAFLALSSSLVLPASLPLVVLVLISSGLCGLRRIELLKRALRGGPRALECERRDNVLGP